MTMLSARTVVTIIALVALFRNTESVYVVPAPTVTQVYDTAVRVDWEMRQSMRFHERVYRFMLEIKELTGTRWYDVDDNWFYVYAKTYYVTNLTLGNTYQFRMLISNNFDGIADVGHESENYTVVSMPKNVSNKLYSNKLYSKPTNVKSTYLGENTDFSPVNGFVANITWQFTSSEIINGFRVLLRMGNEGNHFKVQIGGYVDKTHPFFLLKTRKPSQWFKIQVQTYNYKTRGPLSDEITQCYFGAFGIKCEKTCHCTSNVSCSSLTGVCSDGTCARGWTSLKHTDNNCQTPCAAGFYGENCEKTCSKCDNDQVCNSINGECPATTSTTRIPSSTSRKSTYPKSQSSIQSKPTTKAPDISNKDPNDVITTDENVTPGYLIAILALLVVALLALSVLVFKHVQKKRKQNDVPKVSLTEEDDLLSLANTKRSLVTEKSGTSTRPSCLASSKLAV